MKLELTKKVVLTSVAGIIIVASLAVGGVYAHSKNVAASVIGKVEKQNYENLETLDEISKEIDQFYFSTEGFLKGDLTQETITAMEEKIAKLSFKQSDIPEKKLKVTTSRVLTKQTELKDKLAALKSAFTLQDSVNVLFESPVIVEDQFNDTVALKADTTAESLTAAQTLITGETAFDNLLKTAIDSGTQQLNTRNEAQNLMNTLVDPQGNVLSDATRVNYDSAKALVSTLKEGEVKTNFTTQLGNVLAAIESNEQAEAAVQVEAENSYEDSTTDDNIYNNSDDNSNDNSYSNNYDNSEDDSYSNSYNNNYDNSYSDSNTNTDSNYNDPTPPDNTDNDDTESTESTPTDSTGENTGDEVDEAEVTQ